MVKKHYIYQGMGGFSPDYGLLEKGKDLYLTDLEASQFGASIKPADQVGKVTEVKLRDNVKVKTGGK